MLPTPRHLKDVLYRTAAPWLAPVYSGLGSILMFHRVLDAPPPVRVGWTHQLDVTSALLESLVHRLRAKGYSIVSLDEIHEALRSPRRSSQKLVVFTFDDGHTDTHELAYPVLKSLGAPFTLYLTTGFADHLLFPWWYPLEELIATRPEVVGQLHGKPLRLPTRTQAEREQAFTTLSAAFERATAPERMALGTELFGQEEVTRVMKELPITWEQVDALAKDPLVTIGAHTVNHPILNRLTPEEVTYELAESKRRIEARIGRPVRHFAYPHGSRFEVGEREFALARQVGFDTCVTTRCANLFPGNVQHLECLPRTSGRTLEEIEVHLSGAVSAFRYRGRRVVTA